MTTDTAGHPRADYLIDRTFIAANLWTELEQTSDAVI